MGPGWHLCQRGLHPQEAHASGRSARHRREGCAQVRLAALRPRQPRLVGGPFPGVNVCGETAPSSDQMRVGQLIGETE